jgi:hypothetical protein
LYFISFDRYTDCTKEEKSKCRVQRAKQRKKSKQKGKKEETRKYDDKGCVHATGMNVQITSETPRTDEESLNAKTSKYNYR